MTQGKPADAGDGACSSEPAAAGFKELLANHPSRGPERGWKLNAHLALGPWAPMASAESWVIMQGLYGSLVMPALYLRDPHITQLSNRCLPHSGQVNERMSRWMNDQEGR